MRETYVAGRPLGQAIQRALGLWHQSQSSAGPNFAVLRTFERLPKHCGFDIDVIVDAGQVCKASETAVAAGREAGLLAYSQQKSDRSAKVVWLDPTLDPTHRQWLLLDISSDLAFGPHRVKLDELAIETWENDGFHCTVPTEEWRLTLSALRGLAASDHQSQDALVLAGKFPHLPRVLGNSAVAALSAISRLEPIVRRTKAIAQWRETYGFNVSPKHSVHRRATARARLSRFVFFRLFFWERHRPPFLVITGADGVGKTTLLTHLQQLLNQYPMDFDMLHHLAPLKTKDWQPNPKADSIFAPVRPPAGVARKLAQLVWRYFVPPWVRSTIIGINGELRYASRLNAQIGTSFFSGRAALVDRYVFDRLTRLEIDQRHALQKWAGRLNCRFMRRPRLAILLSDDPTRIHARKNQLSVETIRHYEQRIRLLIAGTQTPMAELRVAGRPPEDLAQKALRLALDALGSDVPALVAAWDRAHRNPCTSGGAISEMNNAK